MKSYWFPMLIWGGVVLATANLSAQSIVGVPNSNADSLVRNVFLSGDCFEVINVQYTGINGQLGTFNNGNSSIGFDSGIILSTGNVNTISGPNVRSNTTTGYGNTFPDADLQTHSFLEGNGNFDLSDIAILEFDFIPTIDSINFEFVFASEEYCEFSGASFYDVFGFFISGPGINGPYTNNGMNIALVPGTPQPVNARNISVFFNQQYYRSNQPIFSEGCVVDPPYALNDTEFDGFTVPLVAGARVQPCQTYHIRLAVADRGSSFDDAWDSAVFLKANSFAAGLTSTIASEVYGPSVSNTQPFEGCGSTAIIFSRGDSIATEDLIVRYDILASSTATPGVDFSDIPAFVTIPAGMYSDTIFVEFYPDGVDEGDETLTIKLRNPCRCAEAELSFTILDPPTLETQVVGPDTICAGSILELAAVTQGGFGDLTYRWSNNDPDSLLSVAPMSNTTYSITVSDECGQADTLQYAVTVINPVATISGEGEICDGVAPLFFPIVLEGGNNFSFTVNIVNQPFTFNSITTDTFWLPATLDGGYLLSNVMADGCPGRGFGVAEANVVDIMTSVTLDTVSCFGSQDGSVLLAPVGGSGQYTYNWSNGNASTPQAQNLALGDYQVTVSDANGCTDTLAFSMPQPDVLAIQLDTVQLLANCNEGGALLANALGGSQPYRYQWSNGIETPENNDLEPGLILLTVLDRNGCVANAATQIGEDRVYPVLSLAVLDTLDCATPQVDISAIGSDVGTAFQYRWTDSNGQTFMPLDEQLVQTSQAGNYLLEIINTNNGCVSDSIVQVENVREELLLSIQPVNTMLTCTTTSLSLQAQSSNTAVNWQWQTQDGQIVSADDLPTAEVNAPGWYFVMVENPLNQCSALDSILISQDTLPPAASLLEHDTLSCANQTVTLEALPTNAGLALGYNWQGPPNGIMGNSNGSSVTATREGIYSVTITDTDNGCTTTLQDEVVNSVDNIVLNPIPAQVITCSSPTVNLMGSSPSQGTLQFRWTDVNATELSTTPDLVVGIPGQYLLELTNLDNDCQTSLSVQVDIDTTAHTIVPLAVDTLTCAIQMVELAAQPGPSAVTPSWVNPAGDTLTTGSWTFSTTTAGLFTLQTTNSLNGCTSQEVFSVLIDTLAPSVGIANPDTITCLQQQITLSGSTPGIANASYSWSGPTGGIVGSNTTPDIQVQTSGQYQLTVTSSGNGCQNSADVFVAGNGVFPELGISAGAPINCIRDSTALTASSLGGHLHSFVWMDLMGNVLSNTAELVVTDTDDYQVVLTNDENGCSVTDTIAASANFDVPQIAVTSTGELNCNGQPVVLTGTTAQPNYQPAWLDALGNVLEQGEWALTVTTAGSYTLLVTDTDNGCTADIQTTVSNNQAFPTANAGNDELIDCFDNQATIDASASSQGNEFIYTLFNSLGVQVASSFEPVFTVGVPDTYTLSVLNTANGCMADDEVLISTAVPAIDRITAIGVDCLGGLGSISVEGVSGGVAPYIYSIDGGQNFQQAAAFGQLSTGNYEVLVQDANGCEAASNTFVPEQEGLQLLLPERVELSFGETFRLNPQIDRAEEEIVQTAWTSTPQLDCNDCMNPTFTASETQQVQLTVVDDRGCRAQAQTLFIVDRRIPVYIPNVFSPGNGDGYNDNFTILSKPGLITNVRSMRIFDRWGNLVFEEKNFQANAPDLGWNGLFNRKPANAGVYIYAIEVDLATGETETYKGDVTLIR